jgi:hypothetical protein
MYKFLCIRRVQSPTLFVGCVSSPVLFTLSVRRYYSTHKVKEMFGHSQKKILPLTEMKVKKKKGLTSNFLSNKKMVKQSCLVYAR